MVAGLEHREQRGGLRGDAAGKRDGAAASFEVRHALFESGHSRIHDARVRVAIFLQIEIRRRRLRILEHIARRLVNRHSARAGIRIGTLSRVHLTCFKSKIAGLFCGAYSFHLISKKVQTREYEITRILFSSLVPSYPRTLVPRLFSYPPDPGSPGSSASAAPPPTGNNRARTAHR